MKQEGRGNICCSVGGTIFFLRRVDEQEIGGKRSDEQKIEFIFQSLLTDGHCPAGRGGELLRRDGMTTSGGGGINISTVIAFS